MYYNTWIVSKAGNSHWIC